MSKWKNEMRFIGTDGSMGLRRGWVYNLLLDKNQVDVYPASGEACSITSLPYTVEGFLKNWREVR